ncbi:MAG: helix-turn-helix domain-containing protein [Clostridiales Family XIII bacterium]|nr:helix-turn-helix domain-containing protein [Clostridiales Family XIII bacterium]
MNQTLKTKREQAGLTQADVAGKAQIPTHTYQRYEYGQRVPNARTAVLIARALGSTVEELWQGQPPLPPGLPERPTR